jgi:hypothetical protein
MSFTDNDLRQLKELMHNQTPPPGYGWINYVALVDLLARLEAAEAVCKLDSREYEHGLHDKKCCDVCQALEAWRKAKGG